MTETPRRRGPFLFLAGSLLALGVATLLDRPVLEAVRVLGPPAWLGRWWGIFRVAGYVDVWLIAVAAVWSIERKREPGRPFVPPRPAMLLLAAIVLSGLAAEGLKLVVRRERPNPGVAEYVFRGFGEDPWRTTAFGLPSSHAAVAFAAAWALGRLVPAARPVWLLLAIGCGATRILDGAHFPSDVVAGALLAYVVTWAVWRQGASNPPPFDRER